MKHNMLSNVASTFGFDDAKERIYRLFLYDYYVFRYQALLETRFPQETPHANAEKMLLNFFLGCVHSIDESSLGLFELFTKFKIITSCNGCTTLTEKAEPVLLRIGFDSCTERVLPMMPNYHLKHKQWVTRGTVPAYITDLPDKTYNLIKDCDDLKGYAEMVDKAIEEFISKLPEECLHGIPEKNDEWSVWKQRLSNLYCIAGEFRAVAKEKNFAEYSPEFLMNDKNALSDLIQK